MPAAKKPTAKGKEYDDIPGTFVFDAERSRQGYPLLLASRYLVDAPVGKMQDVDLVQRGRRLKPPLCPTDSPNPQAELDVFHDA